MNRFRFLRHILLAGACRRILPAPCKPRPATWRDDRVTAALLGHATVLVDFFGLWILTDPVFFARIGVRFGPLTFGPKRFVRCALTPAEIPRIDLVLLSHAHFDHLDLRSLENVNRDAVVVTARATADLFRHIAFREVIEMDWEEVREIATPRGSVTVAAFRLRHWGARMQWDLHRGYNAYVIERGGRRLCFMGDTARTSARHLATRGPIDLLCAPIAAYRPWIRSHCTPEEAVAMAEEAGARVVMPVHHETFQLSAEPLCEPIARFRRALAPERIALTRIGETWEELRVES